MVAQTVYAAFKNYKNLMQAWSAGNLQEDHQILLVLLARDNLYWALQKSQLPNGQTLVEIKFLDQKLLQQAPKISKKFDFEAYRQSFPKPLEQWWWSLDKQDLSRHCDRFFKGLTLGSWAVSLALLGDICRRFLLGGTGVVGLSVITFSTLLTLGKARNDLSDAGRQGIDVLLNYLVPFHWRVKVKFFSTALLNSSLLIFWIFLPQISNYYNISGQTDQDKGKLGTAEQSYNLAISLNPNNADAHYNLGTLYEDIQELDKAETQYLIAIRGNSPDAYNNLARLYLLPPKANPSKAVELLNQGRLLADEHQSDAGVKYSIFKNLGWARLQQKRPELAKTYLETAIRLSEKLDGTNITNPASAHCLLGQALAEKDQKSSASLLSWQRCCKLGDSSNPDEDAWLLKARESIESEGLNYSQVCRHNASPIS